MAPAPRRRRWPLPLTLFLGLFMTMTWPHPAHAQHDPCHPALTATGSPRLYAVADGSEAVGETLANTRLFNEVTDLGHGVATFAGDASVARAVLTATGIDATVGVDVTRELFAVPNDPGYRDQWSLPDVRAPQAWDRTHGSPDVFVADIDSGIDATHGEFAGKLLAGYDATTGAPLATGNSDESGHGTATASVIGAVTSNAVGIASIGWETKVLPIKVGDEPTVSATIAGIRHAIERGAPIINLSLGSACPDSAEQAAVTDAQNSGTLVVAAVGNDAMNGNARNFPAAYPGVLGVGATVRGGAVANYSNFNSDTDIAAPGGRGVGTVNEDVLVAVPGGFAVTAGTSFSSPAVAAAAALLLASEPGLTPAQAGGRLLATARDVGPTGPDSGTGAGLLDVGAAVELREPVVRVSGEDRIGTAAAVSRDSYPSGGASSVVLSRADSFADALAGTPLAVAADGPLLLSRGSALDAETEAEIARVLPAGRTVHLLGGTVALSEDVESRLVALGYATVRYAGADRFDTAVKIADQGLANPGAFILATGQDFRDALVGGAAAPRVRAAVLLTDDDRMHPTTQQYVSQHSSATRYAIGVAAAADSGATAIVGADFADTARKVAERFFSSPFAVGLASESAFPDALGGGVHIAKKGGPLLLSNPGEFSTTTRQYVEANRGAVGFGFVYGGPIAVSDAVRSAFLQAIQ